MYSGTSGAGKFSVTVVDYNPIQRLLSERSMSCPPGTETCQGVHDWGLGYWKNDGFIKTKHKGRIDANEAWSSIRDRWIEQFRNREVHAGQCVTRKVTHENEWCAEAYMETDYLKLTKEDFEAVVKSYATFRLLGNVATVKGDANGESE